MNAALPRFLKSAYRREPLPSFLITAGIVDAAIGGLDDHWSLLAFGLGTIGLAIGLRWWIVSQRHINPDRSIVQHYLPPSPSRPTLPTLTSAKRNPPY
ncbi:MAG: hypothetical protein JOZ78_27160 [Chroococcidiopsidaceae cyanobacterium CP_BM_ER_R8_30]|nr:hypothetical protein [Chroococcidiopsidaceae cyanobacterium CP_BM_ER_R8_30]